MIITPKNWRSFQHYKDRSPTWIKLHRALLDDYQFFCLPVASRALAPCLWLIASEYEDGKIDASLDELAFRLRMTRGDLADALSPLIESRFFDASEPLADCKQDSIPEKRREEEEIEEEKRERQTRASALVDDGWPEDYREQFWARFPNKVGKPKALAKLDGCRKRGIDFSDIMTGLDRYIASKPPDRSWLNPETFINQERWTDQPALAGHPHGTAIQVRTDAVAGRATAREAEFITALGVGAMRALKPKHAGGPGGAVPERHDPSEGSGAERSPTFDDF